MTEIETNKDRSSFGSAVRFLILCILIAVGWYLGVQNSVDARDFKETLLGYPIIISGPIFIGIYIVSTMLVLVGPKDVLRISSALLFGGAVSSVLVTIAEIGNATLLFFMSRTLGRDFVEERFKLKENKSMYEAQKQTSFWTVMALRINPLIPFRFLDLGFGLSNISFIKYLIAIIFASPLRVYWQQVTIAAMGEAFLGDIGSLISRISSGSIDAGEGFSQLMVMFSDFLVANTHVLMTTCVFGLAIVVLTLIAFIVKFLKKRLEGED